MKEQIKTPEKEISNEEITNLSDAQFKTMVVKVLTDIVEYDHKIEEEVKAIQHEIKENIQGTDSEGKETGTQVNSLEQKVEINIRPEQNEENKNSKTMKRGLGTSRTTLNVPISKYYRGARRRRTRAIS